MPVEAAFDDEDVVADEEDGGGEDADDGDGDDGEAGVGGVCQGWGLGGGESGEIHLGSVYISGRCVSFGR